MNICMVIDCLDNGGAERVALTLSDELIKYGNNVTIIVIHPIVKIPINPLINLRILYFEKHIFKYFYNRKRLYILLDQCQQETGLFDVILVHLYLSSRLMKYYVHPCVYHIIHSTQSKSALKNKKGYERWRAQKKIESVYNNLNIICVSQGVQDDLLYVMKIKPKTIRTIYNPFDIEAIRNKSIQEFIRPSEKYIIFVGRLVKEKRINYLLEAYVKSNIIEDLIIVGDGDEMESLKIKVATLGMEKRVYFIGSVENPYPYIQNAKFLVLCSLYEGLPSVLIEALALRTPVIATNFMSGPKEILPYYTMDALVDDNFDNNMLAVKLEQFSKEAPHVDIDCMELFSCKRITEEYLELISSCHKRV